MVEKITKSPEMYGCMDDNNENYLIDVELPGVGKEIITLSMHELMVHVHAERNDLIFHGHMHLPLKVIPEKSSAKFSNGLLRIVAPLKEKFGPLKKIEIE